LLAGWRTVIVPSFRRALAELGSEAVTVTVVSPRAPPSGVTANPSPVYDSVHGSSADTVNVVPDEASPGR